MYGSNAGIVSTRLTRKDNPQAAALAEIIQRVRPDVLLLNEVDYDAQELLVKRFLANYLAVGQNVSQSVAGPAKPIQFAYRFIGADEYRDSLRLRFGSQWANRPTTGFERLWGRLLGFWPVSGAVWDGPAVPISD